MLTVRRNRSPQSTEVRSCTCVQRSQLSPCLMWFACWRRTNGPWASVISGQTAFICLSGFATLFTIGGQLQAINKEVTVFVPWSEPTRELPGSASTLQHAAWSLMNQHCWQWTGLSYFRLNFDWRVPSLKIRISYSKHILLFASTASPHGKCYSFDLV